MSIYLGSNRIAICEKRIQAGSGFLQEKREKDEVSCIKEEVFGAG